MDALVSLVKILPSFIGSLPLILELALRVMRIIERTAAEAKKRNLLLWLTEMERAMDQVEKAKTPEEKTEAARALSEVFRGL